MSGIVKNIPSDAAEIARLIRQADEPIAIRLLQVWGAKQRTIGERNELMKRQTDAQA